MSEMPEEVWVHRNPDPKEENRWGEWTSLNPTPATNVVKKYTRSDLVEVHTYMKEEAWQPIATAPKNRRVLVWSGSEIYAAHWAKNPYTDDESWIVAEWGEEGDQALVKPTHWHKSPEPPKENEK